MFARLLTMPNVLITGHQGFFTGKTLENIARTTLKNVKEFEQTGSSVNLVSVAKVQGVIKDFDFAVSYQFYIYRLYPG